jgi:hypothetical protein
MRSSQIFLRTGSDHHLQFFCIFEKNYNNKIKSFSKSKWTGLKYDSAVSNSDWLGLTHQDTVSVSSKQSDDMAGESKSLGKKRKSFKAKNNTVIPLVRNAIWFHGQTENDRSSLLFSLWFRERPKDNFVKKSFGQMFSWLNLYRTVLPQALICIQSTIKFDFMDRRQMKNPLFSFLYGLGKDQRIILSNNPLP